MRNIFTNNNSLSLFRLRATISQGILGLILCSALTSCQLLNAIGPSETNPAIEATLVRLSADYLRNVATGNLEPLNASILWGDYLLKNKKMSRAHYEAQILALQNHWKDPQQHPLVGLEIVNVKIRGDDSRVILRKAADSSAQEIWIKYYWSGSGWLIVDDSLFGNDNQLFSKIAPNKPTS